MLLVTEDLGEFMSGWRRKLTHLDFKKPGFRHEANKAAELGARVGGTSSLQEASRQSQVEEGVRWHGVGVEKD